MRRIRRSLAFVLIFIIFSTSAFATGIQPTPENEYEFMDYIIGFVLENFKADIVDESVTRESLIEGAYRGIFESLDEHSVYFNAEEYKEFVESSTGEFGGIGISVTKKDKYIEVISPIKDTPGDRADIKSGDQIIKVDGEDITSWELHEAVDVMRGEPGEAVVLTIKRNQRIFDVTIIREIIEIVSVESKMLENGIGYLQIKQFSEGSSQEVKDALFDLKSNNAKGLIIDLRNNPGGYLDEVVLIADYFIDAGENIVHIDYQSQNDRSYITENLDLFDKEIVVLVNEGSASASEILTGAIKDNNEGTIIGTKTYGKGTVQTLIKLPNNAGMKVTVAEYMTAGKKSINKIGIVPDISIDLPSLDENNERTKYFIPLEVDKKIYYGDYSIEVYGIQQRLNFLGENLELDAKFGMNTLSALNRYQKQNDMEETKFIDKSLIDKLLKSVDLFSNNFEDVQLNKAIEVINNSIQ